VYNLWKVIPTVSDVHSVDNPHKLSTAAPTGTKSPATVFKGHTNTTKRLMLMIMIKRVLSY